MENMKKVVLTLTLLLLLCPPAQAITYEYGDTWKNWDNVAAYNTSLAGTDENGDPKIRSLKVTTSDDGLLLTRIDIALATSVRVNYDSLFINTSYTLSSNWDQWTHLVHDGGASNASYNMSGGITPTTDGLYLVAASYSYTYAGTQPGFILRTGNPNGIDAGSLTLLDTSIGGYLANKVITYDFSGLTGGGLALDGGFFVAYSPYCANDLIGGGIAMDPVPEPATMLLFGTGMAGVAGLIRRRQMAN